MSMSNLLDFNIIVVKDACKLGQRLQNVAAVYPASKSNKAIIIVHNTTVGPKQRVSRFQSWRFSKDNQKIISKAVLAKNAIRRKIFKIDFEMERYYPPGMQPPLPSPERTVEVVEHQAQPTVFNALAIEPSQLPSTSEQEDEPNLVNIGPNQEIVIERILDEQIIEEGQPAEVNTNQPTMISVGPVDSNSMDPQLLEDLGMV